MKKQLLLLSVLAVVSGSLVQASGHHHTAKAKTTVKMTGDGDHFYFKDGKLVHGTIYQKTASNGEVSYYYKGLLGMHHTLIKYDGEYYELKGNHTKHYIILHGHRKMNMKQVNGHWQPVSRR